MKNFIVAFASITFSIALMVGCLVGGYLAGVKAGAQMVIGDVTKVTSQGRVVTTIDVEDEGNLNFKWFVVHRPRPFYFPDDGKNKPISPLSRGGGD